MPRIARMVIQGEQAVYHVMSRTALDGYPFGEVEKDYFFKVVRRLSKVYFCEILGICCMGNHFHLLVNMLPAADFSNADVKLRFERYYGKERVLSDGQIPSFRARWSNLSEFVREVKLGFSRFYNRRHNRRGFLWGERFKSVLVEKGETLINCLAYIDLNPVRAGIVEKPEDYRWNSIGYHVQTGNREDFLSLDFGLKAFRVLDTEERLRRYRQFMYEKGGRGKAGEKCLDENVIQIERERGYQLSRLDLFLYRTRYFSDSGIIGSKAFVLDNYQRFKHHFHSKHDKIPKRIRGVDGVYSLKRLTE